jgi:DNA ligase-1
MKAEDLEDNDLDRVVYPVIASPKLDGIRAIKVKGDLLSSSFKPIPNNFICYRLERLLPNGADGEILVRGSFQNVTSAVMSVGGTPDFTFWVFDLVDPENLKEPYLWRLVKLTKWYSKVAVGVANVRVVPIRYIQTFEELLAYETEVLGLGYEGVMLRKIDGPYKCGRSTLKQGWLLKRKPFVDSEARIVGFEERLTNTNELQTNELGLAKRSSSKVGKVPMGTLGTFLAEDAHGRWGGQQIRIGTGKGLTDALRQKVWNDRDSYLGQYVKYKFQKIGSKDGPRLPIFLGFRHPEDLEL